MEGLRFKQPEEKPQVKKEREEETSSKKRKRSSNYSGEGVAPENKR